MNAVEVALVLHETEVLRSTSERMAAAARKACTHYSSDGLEATRFRHPGRPIRECTACGQEVEMVCKTCGKNKGPIDPPWLCKCETFVGIIRTRTR